MGKHEFLRNHHYTRKFIFGGIHDGSSYSLRGRAIAGREIYRDRTNFHFEFPNLNVSKGGDSRQSWVRNKILNAKVTGLTNPIQHGKVGFLSALIIIILLNLQISNLSQNLLKVVREDKNWALNPRRAKQQHDRGQAWNCRKPLELADRAHMEGKMATQGSNEHRPALQQLVNQQFVDEFQSRGQARNKSQKQLLEWKPSWQMGGQIGDTSEETLSRIWRFIWKLFLWVALGTLVIIVEMLVSTKADSIGQRIYSAGLVLGILHYMGNGAHMMVILLACLRGQLELLKILMDSGPKQCPPKRGDTKKPRSNQ